MKTIKVITRNNKTPSAYRFIGQYQDRNGKWHYMAHPAAMGSDLDIVARNIINRNAELEANNMLVLPCRIIRYKLTTADLVDTFLRYEVIA